MRLKPVLIALVLFSVMWTPCIVSAADYSAFKERPRLYFNKERLTQLRSFKNDKPYSDFFAHCPQARAGAGG